jgi:hypothetical protein
LVRHLHALVIGLALAGASTAIAQGATQSLNVSPAVAAPGDRVTFEDHIYGGGFYGTELYLILQSRYAEGSPCGQMPGAIKVATIAWVHNGLNHDGSATFVMPVVPDGAYILGEELPGVTPPCTAAFITVSASRSPDTAMRDSRPSPRILLTLAGFLILVGAMGIARSRLGNERGDQ